MIRIAPQFLQSTRDEEERDYTTRLFVISGEKVDGLSFELRAAN